MEGKCTVCLRLDMHKLTTIDNRRVCSDREEYNLTNRNPAFRMAVQFFIILATERISKG